MKRSQLEYSLPPELIAQHPAQRRDGSRLLVYDRATGDVRHRFFWELPDELRGELVVVNDTRVVPARLRFRRPTGGDAEVLLLEPLDAAGEWEALARPTRKLRPGQRLGSGRADRAPGRGPLAPAADGRSGRRGAASAVHHRAARRSRALPDCLRGRRRLGRGADGRPPLHAGAARQARRRARHAPRRPRHLPARDRRRPRRARDPHASATRSSPRRGSASATADRVLAVGTTTVRVLESLARGAPLEGRTDLFITPPFEFRANGRAARRTSTCPARRSSRS